MRVTKEEIRKMPDGASLNLFLAGAGWDKDFGSSRRVVKVGDRLFDYSVFCDVDEIDEGGEFDVIAAVNEYKSHR